MSRLVRNGKEIFGGVYDASQLTYSNTSSGLTATNAQGAIDEVNGKIPFSLSINEDGVHGYIKIVEGEEVFCPFKSGEDIEYIAPLFDSSVTYNTNDIVLYEELAYKCKEDNVTGDFDETKWEVIYLYEVGDTSSSREGGISFIAPEFSSESTYNKGDYVIYEGVLYELSDDTFSGTWNSTKWEEVTLTDIEEKESNYIAPPYDSTSTYNTDDVVYYKGVVYKCLEDDITGEFNIFKWQDITLSELSGYEGGKLTTHWMWHYYALGTTFSKSITIEKDCNLSSFIGNNDLGIALEIKINDTIIQKYTTSAVSTIGDVVVYKRAKAGDVVSINGTMSKSTNLVCWILTTSV